LAAASPESGAFFEKSPASRRAFLLARRFPYAGRSRRSVYFASMEIEWRRDMTGSAKATTLIDNERVIVTEYRFQPGDNTGWHRHGHDYVIVPMMDGKLKILTKDGESFAEMKKGAPYFRKEGVEHDVISANDGEYTFIEIELR
jgi:quercetin dioxygenase-like cupin family protein